MKEIMVTNKCRRCGNCCMALPNWYDMTDLERACIRLWDKGAELTFQQVRDGRCPHLKFKDGLAICSIYKNRHRFCKAFKCGGKGLF